MLNLTLLKGHPEFWRTVCYFYDFTYHLNFSWCSGPWSVERQTSWWPDQLISIHGRPWPLWFQPGCQLGAEGSCQFIYMRAFYIKIDQIMNISNINAERWAPDEPLCKPWIRPSSIVKTAINKLLWLSLWVWTLEVGRAGQGVLVVFHLWSGLVWWSSRADNLFTIWLSPHSTLNLPSNVEPGSLAW